MGGPGVLASDLERRIALLREELGLTREELVRRAGMDLGYLDHIEENPRAVLSNSALFRLAKALETTASSLAGGDVGLPAGLGRAGANAVLETLTPEQCESHLLAGGVGRVIFCEARGPVALPMNFRFVDDHLVFRTEATASVTGALGALVGFEVDHIDDAMSAGWSVVVTGRAERVEDPSELEELAQLHLEPWAGGVRDLFVRIEAEEISGRSIRQDP